MAEADLYGLGNNRSAAVAHHWGGFQLRVSPRISPWLGVLALLLLKPNRRVTPWLVWLPVLACAGIGWGFMKWGDLSDEGLRLLAGALPTALAFGWAAMLLLVPTALGPQKLGPFAFLLVSLTASSLLALATGHGWQGEMFMDIICAVALQFMAFGLAAALKLAGCSTARRFTFPRFCGWFAIWSILVWVALGIPMATLSLLGHSQALPGVLGIVACCCAICFGVSLPFLLLAAAVPIFRERLRATAVPMTQAVPGAPGVFQSSEQSMPALSR